MRPGFVTWVPRAERHEQPSAPTRPFLIRAGSFVRFGFGGDWGAVGLEIPRPGS